MFQWYRQACLSHHHNDMWICLWKYLSNSTKNHYKYWDNNAVFKQLKLGLLKEKNRPKHKPKEETVTGDVVLKQNCEVQDVSAQTIQCCNIETICVKHLVANLVQSFEYFLVLLYLFHQFFPFLHFFVVHRNYEGHWGLSHRLLFPHHPLQNCFLLLSQIHHPKANFLQNVFAKFKEFPPKFFHSQHCRGKYTTKGPLSLSLSCLIRLVSLLVRRLSWRHKPIKFVMKDKSINFISQKKGKILKKSSHVKVIFLFDRSLTSNWC